ncbi:MAG: host specificity factor TipJ family phage tail protein, partial [Pseudaminobacter sp.]
MPISVRKLPAVPPARASKRRERCCAPARQPVLYVVAPGLEVARETPRKGETVTAFLRRTAWAYRDPKYGWQFRRGLPTILEVNGECVLRKDWRKTRIAANDNVRFVSFPRGGKGGFKQVVGLVALVALAAFAGPLAGMAAGAMGLGGSAIATGVIQAGIMIGGSLLISALTAPKPGATNDPDAKIDQIYSVQAQGNAARLGQPLPVWYGRLKHYPDFAASPWGEFVGNDQYQNILLSTTLGKMEYETLFVDDTPMWKAVGGVQPGFSSARIAFYEPGQAVTLFPVNVHQAAEVSGQQIPDGSPGAWLGGFIANPSGTEATAIALDWVFPGGCFRIDDEGNTTSESVTLTAQYRPVDDAGAPTDDWSMLFSVTRTYANRSPIRDGVKEYLPAGRYEVRFRRDTALPPQNKGTSEVVWAGLRAFLQGDNKFPVSTVAIRIKASESTQGSFRFGVLGTRKLSVWNGSTFVEQATRSPVWAALDIATNATYGAGHALSKVDFNAVVNHAAAAGLRGDKFDYIFSAAENAPDAIDKALTVTRAKHFWLGDTLSVVRDEWRDVPTMMLTDREIVRDSVEIGVELLTERDPDAVVVEYVDETTWRPASVQYPPDQGAGGFNAVQAETKRIDGIVNRDHAFREAAFYYLQSIYRREFVGLKTEYEGRAITYG